MCQRLSAVWSAEADNEKQLLTKRFQINSQIWAHLGEGSEKGKWDDYRGWLSRWEWEVSKPYLTVFLTSRRKALLRSAVLSYINIFLLPSSKIGSVFFNASDEFSQAEWNNSTAYAKHLHSPPWPRSGHVCYVCKEFSVWFLFWWTFLSCPLTLWLASSLIWNGNHSTSPPN